MTPKHLLLAVPLLAAACDPPPSGDEQYDVSWTYLAAGHPVGCPGGATTVRVVSVPLHDDDGDALVDLFDCHGTGGEVFGLPADDYDVALALTDDSGVVVFAAPPSARVTLDGAVGEVHFDVDVGGKSIAAGWRLETAAGEPTTCAGVVQNGVSVLSTQAGTTDAFEDLWGCADGEAPSEVVQENLIVGDYVVALSLLDDADQVVGDAVPVDVVLDAEGPGADLGIERITLY